MKLEVLALDYDGTLAANGVLDPAVREAIQRARRRGIVVVLVTGRILDDLRHVAGDLRFVDAIVAENGAVLAFPETGRSLLLGHPPSEEFVAELRRRGVAAISGECVVEMPAQAASVALEVVQDRELPLVLHFNRGRLMLPPQGISKATGLREALTALRLSEHNALAIGVAENDHALLEVCEVGIAVRWGSRALQAIADDVLDGTRPSAVASFLDQITTQPELPIPTIARRQLTLGTTDTGQTVRLAVRGRNVLVVGDPRSGKSWITGLLAEQLILQRYCVCVIDPEGDYRTLESLPGVTVVGGDDPPPRPREVTLALRHPDVGLVIDLSKFKHGAKEDYIRALLSHLTALRRQTGLPHRIVLDEAHYFLGDAGQPAPVEAERGGYTLVTYRPSRLHPDVRRATDVVLTTRQTDPAEVAVLASLVGTPDQAQPWQDIVSGLDLGEALLLRSSETPTAANRRFRLAPRFTIHVRHQQKYLNVRLMERDGFVFTCNGVPTGERAGTLSEFLAVVGTCADETLDGHLRRGDFSRWIADVFADFPLAAQLGQIEHLYRLRRMLGVRDAIAQAISDRYILPEGTP